MRKKYAYYNEIARFWSMKNNLIILQLGNCEQSYKVFRGCVHKNAVISYLEEPTEVSWIMPLHRASWLNLSRSLTYLLQM